MNPTHQILSNSRQRGSNQATYPSWLSFQLNIFSPNVKITSGSVNYSAVGIGRGHNSTLCMEVSPVQELEGYSVDWLAILYS